MPSPSRFFFCWVCSTLVSYVDRVYQEVGKFLSREFQDNIDVFEQKVEPELGVGRSRASLSMAVLTQFTMAAIAMLIGFLVFSDQSWNIYEILQATISLILIVILCNRFLPFVFFSRTKGEWLVHWTLILKVLIYLVMPVTIALGFLQSVASLTKQGVERTTGDLSRGRRCLDRSWPGRGNYSGRRP